MADNIRVSAGTNDGAILASDDITGIHYPVQKLAFGALDSATLVSTSNGLPVQAQGTFPVTDNNGSLTVDGTVAVTNADLSTLAGAVAGGHVQADIVGALPAGDNNIGNVDLASAIPAGTNNIGDVDVLSLPTGASAAQVQGTVAHDSAAANNPVLLGARAINASPTAVANADVTTLSADLLGKLITVPYAPPELFVSGVTADIVNTTRTEVIAAGAAGVRHYITHILVQNSHATVSSWVNIEDGTTAKYSVYALAGGGGASITLPVPLVGTAATAWNASAVTTGANIRVSMSGYKAV